MNASTKALTLIVCIFALAACGKKEPPPPPPTTTTVTTTTTTTAPAAASVKQVTLAKALDADKKAVAPMDKFAPADTIYAVIETEGVGKAALKAAWTFHKDGKTAPVNETVQEVMLTGPAQNEFHINKPGGWPVGDYQVEISLDGKSANIQKFTVAK